MKEFKKEAKKNDQLKKAQLTINNPAEKGWTHDKIKDVLNNWSPVSYYVMCDEIGGETQTYHTHIYIVFHSPVRFSTLKKKIEPAHIEKAYGTHRQNIEYVKKTGKWSDTEKAETSLPYTLEEYGTPPEDAKGKNQMLTELYTLVKEGYSTLDILEYSADYVLQIDKIERLRQLVRQEQFKSQWRDIETVYIFGHTGTGKSRYVMETYGYENVFRITNPLHPFDTYSGQDVIMFEEFNSTFPLKELLTWIDGYPIMLPCRYSDRVASFTKVYFATNIPLEKQYPNVRSESPEVWQAFLRRINKVMYFRKTKEPIIYDSVQEYLDRDPMSGQPIKFLDF